MKILLIDVNCNVGSTGKIVYDLYSSINADSGTAAVCYGRGPLVQGENIYKFGIDVETYLHAALARLTGYNGCFSFASTRRLIDYIESFQPDLIHLHELHAYFVNIRPLIDYIKKKKIPVVWTFHCEYMYTGKCGYSYDCVQWKTECMNCPAVKAYPKSLFFDRTNAMFHMKKRLLSDMEFTITTPSQWLADRVKQSFLSDKPVKVIHNGIETDSIFYPRREDETRSLKEKYDLDDRSVVLSVAPNIMEERKGGRTVLEIADNMEDLQFVLVGADQDEKYSDNVLLIQRTKDQDELARWYSLADIFLICSKKENFPTTCLEALSCGTPVVGIDEGGTKETAPYPYGLFAKTRTIHELQGLIAEQLNNKLAQDAVRYTAVERYSKKVMYEAYISLYKEVIKRQGI